MSQPQSIAESLTPEIVRDNPASSPTSFAPHIVLVVVQIFFGTFPIAGKIALRVLPSTGLVTLRVVGATACLWLLRYAVKVRSDEAALRVTPKDFLQLVLYSLLGIILNQFLFIKGLSLSTVINATVLGTAIPVWTMIFSIALGYEILSKRKIFGCALAAIGVLYLINPFNADFSGSTMQGDVLLIINTACYGAYIALSQKMIKRYGALTVITWIFTIGCIATIPIGGYFLADTSFADTNVYTWIAVAYIIIFPSVLAYYMNAWALERVVPTTVAVYIYLQPLIAFVLAPLILGEQLNARTGLAAVLIFAGVAVVISRRQAKVSTIE